MRQRSEWGDSFRNVLGKNRRLVTLAMQSKKSDFRVVRKGDEYGVDGTHAFIQRLEEPTRGYRLNF